MQDHSNKTSQTKENFTDRPHALIVDDDRRLRELLLRYLTEQGFVVLAAADAQEALEVLERFEFDVLVVDVMMPGQSGLDLTRTLRGMIDTPVIMLTALGETRNRIEGLEAGADDYLAKPFEPRELLLRLNAILKRTAKLARAGSVIQIGQWQYRIGEDRLQGEQGEVRLTDTETILLRVLAEAQGEVIVRKELARRCGIEAGERTMDVQVTRLRRKIEADSKNPKHLMTIRGKGYLLRVGDR